MSSADDGSDDESDRAAIVARRQRFIALALGSIASASAACAQPCLDIADPNEKAGGSPETAGQTSAGQTSAGQTSAGQTTATPDDPDSAGDDASPAPCLEVAAPEPCLKVAPPREPTPQPCLDVSPPPDEGSPRPCLKVRPPDEPAPQPCLKVAPRDPPEPVAPQPCLKIAKPR